MTSSTQSDVRFDILAASCPTRQVINRIGDRWGLLVIHTLANNTVRFNQLQRLVQGISQKMLTQTLRGLERDGLVHRQLYASVPPKVEYSLTELGQTLSDQIAPLRDWAYAHMDDIETARSRFDAQSP